MKKLLSVLFALALVVACVWVCSTDAHAATQGDYTYTVSDGVAAITGYSGSGGNVTIPATLGGCPVTTIGNFAFYDCSSLTSVTIGNSVKTIGEEAFSDCTSLTSVTIPNSVTTMGDWVFYGCDSLTAVTIPGSVKIIGDGAFCDCASLTKIHVSSNNAYYSNDSKGVLFNKNKTTLI